MPPRLTEILEKALGQVNRANEAIKRFRKASEPAWIKLNSDRFTGYVFKTNSLGSISL